MDIRIEAHMYAYDMCGSSPCEDCNNFRHITTEEERDEYLDCINEARCEEAKEYNKKYNCYVKEYLERCMNH